MFDEYVSELIDSQKLNLLLNRVGASSKGPDETAHIIQTSSNEPTQVLVSYPEKRECNGISHLP